MKKTHHELRPKELVSLVTVDHEQFSKSQLVSYRGIPMTNHMQTQNYHGHFRQLKTQTKQRNNMRINQRKGIHSSTSGHT